MKRWLPAPLLSAFLLLLWLLLNHSLAPAQVMLGLALSLYAPLATRRVRPLQPRIRRPLLIVKLACVVALEIVRSCIGVGAIILGGRHRQHRAGFMRIPLQLRDPHGLAVLSCIINSTPGTVWVELDRERNALTIHVLDLHDEQWWIDTIKSRYEQPLLAIFE